MSEAADVRRICPRRRRYVVAQWLLVIFLPAVAAGQSPADSAAAVQAELGALLSKVSPKTRVSLAVANVADGQRWFAREADTLRKPASVLKLFVSAAALERLGPRFAYKTRVYTHEGELWVVGSGDPALGDDRIAEHYGRSPTHLYDEWAAALQAAGVHTVDTIVLDDSVFERPGRHPDWPAAQDSRWYQAPIGGLNFNDNCLDARVEPRGDSVELILRPELPPTFVTNSLKVGKRHKPIVRRKADSDAFEYVGSVKRSDIIQPASVRRPTVFFGHALKQALVSRGIEVRGQVVRRPLTPAACARARLLAEHETPLPDVLWRCNRFSQNLFAECLLKSLEAYAPDGSRSGRPGSWEGGVAVERAVLAGLGVELGPAVLRDGSGLSHDNLVTAEQVVELLLAMSRHRHSGVFLDSLATPGEDGSMRRRYKDPALQERLRGKTGTLNGVRALAGYARRPDGTTLAFALLCNGRADATLPVKVARILVGP